MRNTVRSLAALLRFRPIQPASPDLAERIIRKAKRIRQRAQTKPRQNSVVPEEATQKKETHEEDRECRNWFYFFSRPKGAN
jgi:hypothetical protein